MYATFWLVQRYTREIRELSGRLAKKQIELMNAQKYASRLGASSIMNVSNLAGISPDLLPRAMTFAQFCDQASSMSATQNLQISKMMGRVPITGNPMQDMQIQMGAYYKLKQESMNALKQQEAMAMQQWENQIALELNEIKTSLEERKESLKNLKQQLSEQARASAISFSLT